MGLSTTYTKTETDFLLQQLESELVSGLKGTLAISDAAPTVQGLYILSDVGTYTNLGGLVTTTGKINYAYFDGTTWSKVEMALPKGEDGKTIENWSTKSYVAGSSVYYNNKIFSNTSNVTSTDIPETSYLWVEQIDALQKVSKILGKNLFDKDSNKIILGKYLFDNGDIYSNELYFISDFISVKPNTTYTHQNFSMGGAKAIIYDANKNFVSAFNTNTVTTPSNGYFIRMSGLIANMNTQQFEIGNTSTLYESYTDFKPIEDIKNELKNDVVKKSIGKNLFNKNTVNNSHYLLDDGNIANNETYFISDYIKIQPNTTYTNSNFGVGGAYHVFYDENKTVISSFKETTKTSPSNAKYVRLSGLIANKDIQQFEIGSKATAYEPYTEISALKFIDQIAEEVKIVLPKKLYFLKDRQLSFYFENILFKNLSDPTTVYFSQGLASSRQNSFTYYSAETNKTFTGLVVRNFKKGETKTITYDVKDGATNAGKNLNVLFVGDSFTDIGTYVKESRDIIASQGVSVNLVGIGGDSTFRAEGLSGGTLKNTILDTSYGVARILTVTGMTQLPSTSYPSRTYRDANGKDWIVKGGKIDGSGNGKILLTKFQATESDFAGFPTSGTLTKQSTGEGDATINYTSATTAYGNPFINPATGQLDINNYLTTWSQLTPNIIVLQFTWNDLNIWETDSNITTLVSQFKAVIDHIHSSLPSCKLIISIEPFGAINGSRDVNGKKWSVLKFTRAILKQFEDDTNYSDWVKVAPSYACVDLVYGYSDTTITPNNRISGVTERSGGDGVHPSTSGMNQIADCIASIISNLL